MLRHAVQERPDLPGGRVAPARDPSGPPVLVVLRLIVAPLAAIAAGLAGLLFALLLPICGIASIAEGIAKTSWRFVRDTLAHLPRRRAHRI